MTVGARHRFSVLDRAFRYHKAASKSLYQAYTGDLNREINRLRWSDPSLLASLIYEARAKDNALESSERDRAKLL
jgi:hypothetical protein